MKERQTTFLQVLFAGISAAVLVPALFVGVQVATCIHSSEHWEHLVMMGVGPVCLLASAILLPLWAGGLKPVFGIMWAIAALFVAETTITAFVL